MKKLLILGIALLLISGNAVAQGGYGYIGLFVDDMHSTWCTTASSFDMYVWCLPSTNGMMGFEHAISYPGNIIPSTVTSNSSVISVCMGDLSSGISCGLNACEEDWIWTHKQTLFVTDGVQTNIEIIEHPDVGAYQFTNCEDGFPIEACVKFTDIMVNTDPTSPSCVRGTGEESWGAIKSLYK